MAYYVAVDVGGTNLKYSLLSGDAEFIDHGEMPTPKENGLEDFSGVLKEIYQKYEDCAEAFVLSAPGKINSETGYFYSGGALSFLQDINLVEKMKEYIPLPFAVENDGKAAALAELWKGSMHGIQNGMILVLGSGIGGAIIIDGKLYRGSSFAAGEFSVIPMHLDEFPFQIQNIWTLHSGVPMLIKDYAQRIHVDASELNGKILFEAANNGQIAALDAIDQYTKGIVSGILSLQIILDTEKIAIGGGISKQPLLLESLRKNMNQYIGQMRAYIPCGDPKIESCTFGNDANMIGALYHYLFEIKK